MSLWGGRKSRGLTLWVDFLGIQRFGSTPEVIINSPTLPCFPPCWSLGHAGCGLRPGAWGLGPGGWGLWTVQWSWHAAKAHDDLLLEDRWAAYMAVHHFCQFLWSEVKCLAAPPHIHAHTVSSRAKYCGISGHVSEVWTVSELVIAQALITSTLLLFYTVCRGKPVQANAVQYSSPAANPTFVKLIMLSFLDIVSNKCWLTFNVFSEDVASGGVILDIII